MSNNFLASEFILQEELPELLRKAENNKIKIFVVLLDHNVFHLSPLSKYQSFNKPTKPLCELDEVEKQKTLVRLAEEIHGTLKESTKIDDTRKPPKDDFSSVIILTYLVRNGSSTIAQLTKSLSMKRKVVVSCIEKLYQQDMIIKENKAPCTTWRASDLGLNAINNFEKAYSLLNSTK